VKMTEIPAEIALILDQLNHETRRVRWSPQQVHENYCQRTTLDIDQSKTINFSSPCADMSALCALLAFKVNLQPTLVLAFVARPMQHVKVQCNLEIKVAKLNYVVGFSERAFHIFQGEIVPTVHRQQIFRQPFEVDNDRKPTFLKHFHDDGLWALREIYPQYKPELDIRWHQQRNRKWRYLWTRMRSRSKKGSTVYSSPKAWA
jgi:hypothetical protein